MRRADTHRLSKRQRRVLTSTPGATRRRTDSGHSDEEYRTERVRTVIGSRNGDTRLSVPSSGYRQEAVVTLPDGSLTVMNASPGPAWKCRMESVPTVPTKVTPGCAVSWTMTTSPLASTKLPRRIVAAPQPSPDDARNVWPMGSTTVHAAVGATVSVTVTRCVVVDTLPDASVAVHVTVVVPTSNVDGASLTIEGAPAQSSTAVAAPSGIGPQSPAAVSVGTNVKIGFVVSAIVIVCVVVAVRPWVSVAVHVTVFAP